ncbi:diguanylate cyclase [Acinetobacter sp. ANC 4633]|uniref:sensor domain-containing diguanylate cyclase n=1 Tax=Acinetobacter sp. ANC 4633 TaxID=2529845 RepID=UPI0010402B10|nr:sensor domain-containing diguanylate cyclase [Acinetobacter sp. ANC 4633]TCB26357.1 diguanylate cyclase [Acinetobacter sp. ANC 4633]
MNEQKEWQFYKALVETTKAIPWKMDWNTKEFSYIGPQIEDILGWSPDSCKTAQDWIDRMHPDDREPTINMCIALSNKGTDYEADYRALNQKGDYVWIRDVVHVLRENNKTMALIGFMFDISERKRLELELEQLNKRNQELLLQDPLTQVSNRQALKERLHQEFKRAQCNQRPLSILFIDIDHFKKYNDEHGHLQGDHCLIAVAQLLKQMFNRAYDFVARFGGEEFVVLLPETSQEEAIQLAEHFRKAVNQIEIPLMSAPKTPKITVSIGVNTHGQTQQYLTVESFIRSADELLYLAKDQGRNQVRYYSL